MWLADHMHTMPHAERHVLEVCQFETPAVFMSATLPGCTHAYAGQTFKRDEALWWVTTDNTLCVFPAASTRLLLINSRLVYNCLNDGSFPRIHWSVQMARRVVSCILGLSIVLATCRLATQIQKGRAALPLVISPDVTSCQSFVAAAVLRACRTVWTMAATMID